MNPEIKEQWVAALRSGDYPQGTGHLNYDGEFCCLGVLCELAAKAGVVGRTTNDSGIHVQYGDSLAGEDEEFPSDPILDWAELSTGNPVLSDGHHLKLPASVWNDDEGASFAEIADMIEASL